jgi:ATP-dependent DNA ligase
MSARINIGFYRAPAAAVKSDRLLGALLLGYYTDDGKLIYAGRVGTGMSDKVLLRKLFDTIFSSGLRAKSWVH